ncbi:VOC family protein [Fictibacillus barbaricus]|uniref:Catechol-2,3-dioxygenase n=1 Tax=Fictibacillus barbaricus TaxID=182136 RepID=A0ABU1TX31_9BACL|nr:VOC family protein [Fictibacillus barbaricus]MDR7071751.1 catechol-2,3-dioxygenase [Fictibacillus barbaricus]
MNQKLLRVGTTYLPVRDPKRSAIWYSEKLGAEINFQDEAKVIINLANQSFFLVKSSEKETSNFKDQQGNTRFCLTFEVDGLASLYSLQKELKQLGVQTGDIENRGHSGENFTFTDPDGNIFDVWSELSPTFKQMQNLLQTEV